jgi:hypothetical protein
MISYKSANKLFSRMGGCISFLTGWLYLFLFLFFVMSHRIIGLGAALVEFAARMTRTVQRLYESANRKGVTTYQVTSKSRLCLGGCQFFSQFLGTNWRVRPSPCHASHCAPVGQAGYSIGNEYRLRDHGRIAREFRLLPSSVPVAVCSLLRLSDKNMVSSTRQQKKEQEKNAILSSTSKFELNVCVRKRNMKGTHLMFLKDVNLTGLRLQLRKIYFFETTSLEFSKSLQFPLVKV